jgi:hypothetical protein
VEVKWTKITHYTHIKGREFEGNIKTMKMEYLGLSSFSPKNRGVR